MSQFDRERRPRQHGTAIASRSPGLAPGKQTLVQQASWQSSYARPVQTSTGAAPVQAPSDDTATLDPSAVQVDQYAPGTDIDRFNDCGPAMVLMALRAMGAEPGFRRLVAAVHKPTKPEDVTLQQQLTYIRAEAGSDTMSPTEYRKAKADAEKKGTTFPEHKVDQALAVGQMRSALVNILHELKIKIDDKAVQQQLVLASEEFGFTFTSDQDSGEDAQTPRPPARSRSSSTNTAAAARR